MILPKNSPKIRIKLLIFPTNLSLKFSQPLGDAFMQIVKAKYQSFITMDINSLTSKRRPVCIDQTKTSNVSWALAQMISPLASIARLENCAWRGEVKVRKLRYLEKRREEKLDAIIGLNLLMSQSLLATNCYGKHIKDYTQVGPEKKRNHHCIFFTTLLAEKMILHHFSFLSIL